MVYPDPAVEVIDPRFAKYKVINAAVERLYTGTRWAEGPVWFGDGRYLLFSDIPNNRMLRWLEDTGEVSVFRSPSNYSNGNSRDRQGRLLTCEHDTRRVTRTEYDGTITVLMDRFQGKKLNAPNDLVVHSDGASGLAILVTASCRITKATRLPSSCLRMFTGSTRKRARRPSLPVIWISPTGCVSPPMKKSFTSWIREFQSIPATRVRFVSMTLSMACD